MSELRNAQPATMGVPRLSKGTPVSAKMDSYGLRSEILSPMETLAQSVSTIAPTATPAITIPLVYALAGNGTWLAYVLATVAVLLVAWCIGRFASYSSSPGSLYSYAAMILPPWLSSIAAWSLLLAYIATASSVIGGLYQYAIFFVGKSGAHPIPAVVVSLLVTGVSIWIAWLDVKISARLMLWIEVISVFMILTLVTLVLVRYGFHIDSDQLHLRGMTGSGLRLGLVLAIFSFVGFESATTMGAEARNPLKSIPRAVMLSSIFGGAFFTLCAYTEVMGLRTVGQDLGTSQAPLHVLATGNGLPLLGRLIEVGLLVSLSAGTLASITAAARVLLLMAHNGLAHDSIRVTHARHETPHRAIAIAGVAAVLPVIILAVRRNDGLDIYGWLGSLATYGFIIAYGLVSIALPRFLRDRGIFHPAARVIPYLALVAMLLALAGNLYPVPEGPYGKLPYIYLAYLSLALVWFALRSRGKSSARGEM
jgi:amino acid transporter